MQQQVTEAYQAYQTAFDAALKEAHQNYNAPTPPAVKQATDQLMMALSSIP